MRAAFIFSKKLLTEFFACGIKDKRASEILYARLTILSKIFIIESIRFPTEETDMTTMAKKETVQRKWYVLDAAGKPLGRTAVIAANLLRGKHKVDFTPNVDCGDYVIIINTDKAILTGKKAEQKTYYRVSGWIGGLKETKARTMMENRSDYAMELAVKGMLPKNTLGRNCLTRLHLYKGEEHNHAAQKPEAWTLN